MSRNEVCKIFMPSKIVFHFIRKFIMRIALAKFSIFSSLLFLAGSAKKDCVAYFVFAAKTRGWIFDLSRRGWMDFHFPYWETRNISFFASLMNSFTESSRQSESRIPFQRISNYRRWFRAFAVKPVLCRELLIRFSQRNFVRPYKFHDPSKHPNTRYTSPYPLATNYQST